MSRLAGALVMVLLLAACGDGGATSAAAPSESSAPAAGASPADDVTSGDGDGLLVIATTSILGDLATQVVGAAGTVETLLPIGADPHGFAPSAAQASSLRDADLVVANGLDLEEGLVSALDSAEDDGVAVFHATDHVEIIEFGEGGHDHAEEDHSEGEDHDHAEDDQSEGEDHDHAEEDHSEGEDHDHAEDDHSEGEDHDHAEEDGHDHDHDGGDPHIWFDVARMAQVVEALGEELDAIDPAAGYADRAQALVEELTALDEEIDAMVEDLPDEARVLVTNHEALGYFADAYGFEVAATIIPGGTTLAEPSAADLEDVIAIVADTGTGAIFAETTAGSRIAEVVAEEVGGDVEVVELYTESLSDADGPATTYVDMMRTNAERITEALAA